MVPCHAVHIPSKRSTHTASGNKKRSDYFSTFPGAAAEQSGPVGKVINELKSKHSKLGAAGFCWGWKAIVLANDLDKVDAIATGHPS